MRPAHIQHEDHEPERDHDDDLAERASGRPTDRCRSTARRAPCPSARSARSGGRTAPRPAWPGRPCGPGSPAGGRAASASSRRSRSAPPSSWAMSRVSQVASAVGSASWRLSTSSVRAKSVDSIHSRWAAANAGRSSTGRRPTDLEQGLGHRSAGPSGEDADLVDEAGPRVSGLVAAAGSASAIGGRPVPSRRTRPSTSAGRMPPNTMNPATRPTTASAAITPTNSPSATSPSPAWAIQSCTRCRGVRRSDERGS